MHRRKKILLIGMNFYQYEKYIIDELHRRHLDVLYFQDAPYFFMEHFNFIPLSIKNRLLLEYQRRILQHIDCQISHVIVIVGRYLMPEFLVELKRVCSGAKTILYLWDDVKRVENFYNVYNLYDIIYSFDPVDVSRHKLKFLPLFYNKIRSTCYTEDNVSFELYSAMANHSDRASIINKILETTIKSKIVLRVDYYEYFRHFIFSISKDTRIKYTWRGIKYEEILNDMLASKAILDIQFANQNGLTMRTFDVLSVQRKLITTNSSIKYYNFYNPHNIYIMDRDNPKIPKNFFEREFIPTEKKILDMYNVVSWVERLLYGTRGNYLIKGNPYGL